MEVIIPARQRPVDNLRGNGKPPGSLYDVTMTASIPTTPAAPRREVRPSLLATTCATGASTGA
jgi:hypothetical protein